MVSVNVGQRSTKISLNQIHAKKCMSVVKRASVPTRTSLPNTYVFAKHVCLDTSFSSLGQKPSSEPET